MHLYNTKTKKLEKFKPLKDREVKIYYCGPTVYNYAHIGNLRTFIFEDLVVKTLKFLGYNVKTTMNITDLDDKTIKSSIKAGKKLSDFTKKYTDSFLEDIQKINIQKADNIVPITIIIPEMVRMIQTMLNRKNAYLSDDSSIYFDIKSFKKYGNFANIDLKGIKSGARVDNDEYDKSCVSDFVLWKAYKKEDGDNFWKEIFKIDGKSIILKGRPGWHIECSACSMKYFGPQIDIHMGGIDLIFPHNQNEIAQSESCSRKEFVKYWLHSAHLMVDGKKMSKSNNNFYTLSDIEKKFKKTNKSVLYRAIRLGFINAKYSSQLDFSFSKLEANINSINSIDKTISLIFLEINNGVKEKKGTSRDFRNYIQEVLQEYVRNLEDDFNIPKALTVYHDLSKFVNTGIRDKNFSLEEIKSILGMFETMNDVLGIFDFKNFFKIKKIPKNILEKLELRNNAKLEKKFDLADKLRHDLLNDGYKVIDYKDKSRIEKI